MLGVSGSDSVVASGGYIASSATAQTANATDVLVRSVDLNSGILHWESSQPVYPTPSLPGIATGGGRVVAAAAANYSCSYGNPTNSLTWVAAYDEQNGAILWQKSIGDYTQLCTYVSEPVIDAGGDVYVGFGTYVPSCTTWSPCYTAEQSLLKLKGADGTLLWRFDNTDFDIDANQINLQMFPQLFTLLGGDVALFGPFGGALAGHDVVKLSGLDGSVQWTSDVFGGDYTASFHVAADGNLIVIGANSWVKLDAGSGATVWANPLSPTACNFGCSYSGALGMPNGDTYYFGESEYQPYMELFPGATGSIQRQWQLPNNASLSSNVLRATADSSDHVWLKLYRHFRSGGGVIDFLVRFDPNSGTLLGQQALVGYDSLSSLMPYTTVDFLAAPENNRLPVVTYLQDAPAPSTTGNAVIDTTVRATGDISVETTVDHVGAHLGDTVGFHVVVKYSGNNPLTGAHAIVDLYQAGDLSNLSCVTQGASNCVLDSRFGGLATATFDIQPGGQIEIAGQLHVTSASATLMAKSIAYGPVGLSEQDTLNNFSPIEFGDEIFKDGF
jgi:hypothetical protein